MACQVFLEFQVKEGCRDELKKKMGEILPDTRAFDGCTSIYLTQDIEDSSKMIAVEVWETKGHYDKYLQWRTDRGDMDMLGTMLENPSWRFLEMLDV